MKCSTRKASIAFMLVEIAIIISAMVFISVMIGRSTDFSGRVTKENKLTKELGSVDVTSVIGNDASDGDIDTIIMRVEGTDNGINLEDAVIIVNVGNVSARLKYRNGTLENDMDEGYYTR